MRVLIGAFALVTMAISSLAAMPERTSWTAVSPGEAASIKGAACNGPGNPVNFCDNNTICKSEKTKLNCLKKIGNGQGRCSSAGTGDTSALFTPDCPCGGASTQQITGKGCKGTTTPKD